MSRKSKLKLYWSVIRPLVVYGCETWVLKESIIQRLSVFERKILGKIFGSTKEDNGNWKKKKKKKTIYTVDTVDTIYRVDKIYTGTVDTIDTDTVDTVDKTDTVDKIDTDTVDTIDTVDNRHIRQQTE